MERTAAATLDGHYSRLNPAQRPRVAFLGSVKEAVRVGPPTPDKLGRRHHRLSVRRICDVFKKRTVVILSIGPPLDYS